MRINRNHKILPKPSFLINNMSIFVRAYLTKTFYFYHITSFTNIVTSKGDSRDTKYRLIWNLMLCYMIFYSESLSKIGNIFYVLHHRDDTHTCHKKKFLTLIFFLRFNFVEKEIINMRWFGKGHLKVKAPLEWEREKMIKQSDRLICSTFKDGERITSKKCLSHLKLKPRYLHEEVWSWNWIKKKKVFKIRFETNIQICWIRPNFNELSC